MEKLGIHENIIKMSQQVIFDASTRIRFVTLNPQTRKEKKPKLPHHYKNFFATKKIQT